MGGNYVNNAGVFLIQTLVGLYALTFMLRFLLQLVRADFYNPFSQFLVKVTNPVVKPLRKIIPGIAGIDWASVVAVYLLMLLEFVLIGLLPRLSIPTPQGLLLLALAESLSLLLNVFLFSIIIQAVISWINPGSYNPVVGVLHQLTAPVLAPFRRLIPPISGLDLSPMAAIIVLYLINLLFIHPITDIAQQLAYMK
ncbi:MAG: YggT family protein [Gammaproteobacteria bacterium]|nr:YggT family protein [Gammaproteobacteria bacterium]